MGVHELEEVRNRIAAAERDTGRAAGAVTLVAVSKTFGPEAIVPILEAGHRTFGENRVQEAIAKWPALRERYPRIELHLIGPLQTNKAAVAVALFDCIETLDRPKLAGLLAKEMQRQNRRPKLFIQVNTGDEPQKAGIAPDQADAFIAECRDIHGFAVDGLMCIPPEREEPALHFALLEKIARRNGIAKLSMGMSADFETAIRFGATHVRIGSAIFGSRE
jgi:pyridoxal phosphate enzyme (YggS family)